MLHKNKNGTSWSERELYIARRDRAVYALTHSFVTSNEASKTDTHTHTPLTENIQTNKEKIANNVFIVAPRTTDSSFEGGVVYPGRWGGGGAQKSLIERL